MRKNLVAFMAASAVLLSTSPALADTRPARTGLVQVKSVKVTRAGTEQANANQFAGMSPILIILAVSAAVAVTVAVASSGSSSNSPN